MQTRVCVTGAGGFIGGHLSAYLKKKGYWVRGVDIKAPEYRSILDFDEFKIADLRYWDRAMNAIGDVSEVYGLAADMGGIGFITHDKAAIVRNNTLINLNTIEAARLNGIKRYFYTSSACAYPGFLQNQTDAAPLKEEDAYPADPEDGYGWEKLYFERVCRHYREDYGMETRIVRFHNTYGPLGTYDGGREKSPAAICRKIALADDGDEIEVWGDGEQTRSYNYIDDCVEGIYRLMRSDYREPLNLGQDRMISINQLVDMVARIAGKKIRKRYNLTKPQGVRGRNSDNTRLREVLNWEPQISLEQGLVYTYNWINDQVHAKVEDASTREAVAV
jgi:nucleoside-diphosphate-sugar epimerase